jgi:hydrogenase large subunit
MKGKDPRDAHFITSRICGICGDNHATCSNYAQNMAFDVRPPALAEWIVNLGEAAEYMFDHNIFQDNLVGVDFCEQMVKETNPSVWEKAQHTAAPHAEDHGYKTIADIMTALNPFTATKSPITFCLTIGASTSAGMIPWRASLQGARWSCVARAVTLLRRSG